MADTARVTITGTHDDSKAPVTETGGRPDNVPEKFWNSETNEVNQEALLEAHASLESRFGAEGGTPPVAPVEGAPDTLEITAPTEGPAAELFTPDKMQEYATAMAADGTLTAEQMEAFKAVGLPDEVVTKIGQAFVTEAAGFQDEVIQSAGGSEAFKEVAEWYGANASDADLAAYNAAVKGTDKNLALLAAKGMVAEYQKANGRAPGHKASGGGQTPPNVVEPYGSWGEVAFDMRNPEHKSNPAFQARVVARMKASNLS